MAELKKHVIEKVPNPPIAREGEASINWAKRNNSLIIMGRDRPSTIDSGYGNDQGAGTIHMVVGRKNQDLSFEDDSAFIYTTMKTDIDKNLGYDGLTNGEGESVPVMVGPANIVKSDNVRIVFREDKGDIRIISQNGENFIHMTKDHCEIKIGSTWINIDDSEIKIKATQSIVLDASKIQSGDGATEPYVLGNALTTYLSTHTHTFVGVAPGTTSTTLTPVVPPGPDILSTVSFVK